MPAVPSPMRNPALAATVTRNSEVSTDPMTRRGVIFPALSSVVVVTGPQPPPPVASTKPPTTPVAITYTNIAASDGAGIAYRRQASTINAAFDAIMELGLELGGTITGEHGIGRLKQPLLRNQLGDDVLDLQHAIRKVWDPDRLLNPGAGY